MTLKCLFYYFTLISIFSLTEHGHFRFPFTRLESADSLIKKQTWQKTLHNFNHNLYLSFSRQHWLKPSISNLSKFFNLPLCSIRGCPSIKTGRSSHQSRAELFSFCLESKLTLFSNKANHYKTNAIAISISFKHFIRNASTFQTLKTLR